MIFAESFSRFGMVVLELTTCPVPRLLKVKVGEFTPKMKPVGSGAV